MKSLRFFLKGSEPVSIIPTWTEPVFPHLDDEDLYEIEEDDDEGDSE